jgi:hypothetical protein
LKWGNVEQKPLKSSGGSSAEGMHTQREQMTVASKIWAKILCSTVEQVRVFQLNDSVLGKGRVDFELLRSTLENPPLSFDRSDI